MMKASCRLLALAACLAGSPSASAQNAERDKAVAEIKKCGGKVDLDADKSVVRVDYSQSIITDDGLAVLKALPTLRVLQLNGTQISDRGLEQIKVLTALEVLDLNSTGVTDKGLAHLKGLKQLRTLELGDCGEVTNDGVAHLKELAGLEKLFLSGTQINDSGLVHLRGLTKLQTLHFFDTDITDDGIKDLKKSLPNTKISK